jgi:hypothetical protein
MREKSRGVIYFLFLVVCAWLVGASVAQAETWQCTKPDGSVVYSDQNLSGQCRKLDNLPPLLRVPSAPPPPPEEANPEKPPPVPPEPEQVPTPGRGRRIDPPSDAAIMYTLVGQELRVRNVDPDWTAEKVCIEVERSGYLRGLGEGNYAICLDPMRPAEERTLMVSTGLRTDVKLGCVQWGMLHGASMAIMPPNSAIKITRGGPGAPYDFTVKNLDLSWIAKRLCVKVLILATYGEFNWRTDECTELLMPLQERAIAVAASYDFPFTWDASIDCVQWTR